jgi:hypothetical protein
VLCILCGVAYGAGTLSEAQALAKAISILAGDPYGGTPKEVAANIQEVQLIAAGSDHCQGRIMGPVWQFHVVVPKERMKDGNSPIDGYLVLNARTGKIVCAGLPFLD